MRKRLGKTWVLLCGIVATGSVTCLASEEKADACQEAYGNILWQYYRAWASDHDIYVDQEPESIINYLVFRGMVSDELKYSLYDIDSNGIPELLIGFGEADNPYILDIFTNVDGDVIHLFDGGERWYLTMYEDGIIGENSSGGAAHNYQRYFSIGEDGKSCITELYYYLNSEMLTVEDIDGNVFLLENREQYFDIYEEIELDWTVISEPILVEEFGEQDECGSALTRYDIFEAPQFKNGLCENSLPLLLDAYRRISEGNEYSTYFIQQDYYEENPERDVFFVEDQETNSPISTIYVNLRTGEAEEVFRGGKMRTFSIFATDIAAEPETDSENLMETEINIQFEHMYEENMEFATIIATDISGDTVWTYDSGKYSATQLQRVKGIGVYEERYYFCEDGHVFAVDIYTGDIIWRSDGGCGSPSAHLWDSEGTLYLCGYYGPDLVMISSEGVTLGYVDVFYENAYGPYGLEFSEDNILKIAYENGAGEFQGGGVLHINLDTLEVINIPEITEDEEEYAFYYQVVNCNEYITLRAEPSTTAMELDRIPLGARVEMIELAENGFYLVDYDGQMGYALDSYLQPVEW